MNRARQRYTHQIKYKQGRGMPRPYNKTKILYYFFNFTFGKTAATKIKILPITTPHPITSPNKTVPNTTPKIISTNPIKLPTLGSKCLNP